MLKGFQTYTKNVLLFGCLTAHFSSALAGPCCNTPTVWTFKNESKAVVTLSCRLESTKAWTPTDKIELTTRNLGVGETYEYKWGREWYNDGMGLVPGNWACHESKNAKNAVKFTTDWGENITILWKGSEVVVARAADKAEAQTKPKKN